MSPFILENNSILERDFSFYPDGIIIPIDKPYRWSSTDVVQKIKFHLSRYFNLKKIKIGHAGTLDPLATGVLLVCVGKATKIANSLQNENKEYVAQFTIGATTPSYDREHPIDEVFEYKHIEQSDIENTVNSMIGEQEQVPPIFSAKLINGQRSYIYARQGEKLDLKANRIVIYNSQLLSIDWLKSKSLVFGEPSNTQITTPPYRDKDGHNSFVVPKRNGALERGINSKEIPVHITENSLLTPEQISDLPRVCIRISCSKGTYIRSCARDFGLSLKSGAYMSALIRTKSGGFELKNALSLDTLLKKISSSQ